MKITKTLNQLQRDTERYVHGAKAGRRDRLLAASIFGLCDDLRERSDSENAKAIAKRIADDTETLIRLAHAADGTEFYAAWAHQRNSATELRSIIASERTD